MIAICAATATNLVRKKKPNQFILEKNILDQKQSHGKKTQSSLISKYSKSVFASLQDILIHLNRNITLLMQFAILGL